MIDFATARRMMVDGQIRTADVTDPRLIAAMLDLPREKLFPQSQASLAYLDREVPLGGAMPSNRRSLKPMVLAKLVHSVDVAETDHVLDVGCGTGYSTALLARLTASVVGLEEDAATARLAADALAAVGAKNATIVTGALNRGWPDRGPYDLIILQGAVEIVPKTLLGQLKRDGRLACVVGLGPSAKATIFRRADDDISEIRVFDACAALLPGFEEPQNFAF
jgi:protein-L-isoaspartate(D-aspartate) O-methyltransferase